MSMEAYNLCRYIYNIIIIRMLIFLGEEGAAHAQRAIGGSYACACT